MRPCVVGVIVFFFSSRRRHTRLTCDWSSDVCSSDLRKAWDGQFSPERLPAGRPDNLYRPVARDAGAHGRFDREAHATSWQVQAAQHRGLIGLGIALGALLGVGMWNAKRR